GALCSVDRIIVRNWQSRDLAIGFGALARPASKQVPVAPVRGRAPHREIGARADILVSHAGWNYDQIARMHLDTCPLLAADPQLCMTAENTQHLMRRAVIMR